MFDNLGALLNKITKKPKIKTEIIEEEKQLDKYASTRYLNNYDNLINRESVMNLGNLVADSRLISPTLNSLYNQDLLATQINLSRTCVCCGESFVSSDYTLSVYGNRCEKCQDIMSIGKNCSECGKHYHYSYLAVSSAVPSFL